MPFTFHPFQIVIVRRCIPPSRRRAHAVVPRLYVPRGLNSSRTTHSLQNLEQCPWFGTIISGSVRKGEGCGRMTQYGTVATGASKGEVSATDFFDGGEAGPTDTLPSPPSRRLQTIGLASVLDHGLPSVPPSRRPSSHAMRTLNPTGRRRSAQACHREPLAHVIAKLCAYFYRVADTAECSYSKPQQQNACSSAGGTYVLFYLAF